MQKQSSTRHPLSYSYVLSLSHTLALICLTMDLRSVTKWSRCRSRHA